MYSWLSGPTDKVILSSYASLTPVMDNAAGSFHSMIRGCPMTEEKAQCKPVSDVQGLIRGNRFCVGGVGRASWHILTGAVRTALGIRL